MRDFANKEISKIEGLSYFLDDFCRRAWVIPILNAKFNRGEDVDHLLASEEELYRAFNNKIAELLKELCREYVLYSNSTLASPPICAYLLKKCNQLSDEIDIYKEYCDQKATEYEEKYK